MCHIEPCTDWSTLNHSWPLTGGSSLVPNGKNVRIVVRATAETGMQVINFEIRSIAKREKSQK